MKNTILLVDDEADIRTVMKISLTDSGYEVLAAQNGEEALRIFKSAQPQVVLTDIKMPGMDGIELLRHIKHENPDTEVVMITGHGDIDMAIMSFRHEAADFITKPISEDALEITLKRAFERIAMKQKVRECDKNRAMYDVLINELIQEDILVIGSDYRIMDINETLLSKLGLNRKDVIGQFCYKITHKQNAPCSDENHLCPLVKTLETQKPSQETHVHRDKDNNNLYSSISVYPLFENGEVIGAIELSRDITREIHMQQTMMQQEKLASIGRLSAGVAHEINNPLTTILTTSMLIQEDIGPDDPTYQELETIVKETLRCRKIVSSLLDFARETKPAKKLNSINEVISECLILTRKQAAFKDVILLQDLSPEIPDIHVDKDQIQQALINLILNAAEATNPGGTVTVSSVFNFSDEVVEVAIRDSGKGIAEEVLDKIFDPFFTTKESGTGLGLAITHGIVKRHGGTIDVESKPGHDTTITIKLPVNKGNKDVH